MEIPEELWQEVRFQGADEFDYLNVKVEDWGGIQVSFWQSDEYAAAVLQVADIPKFIEFLTAIHERWKDE